jgi:hypothetical protein
MSISTRLYRLPLAKLQELKKAAAVKDAELSALRGDSLYVDQGIAYSIRNQPDVFAYVLDSEAEIAHEFPEVTVQYLSPPQLKDRLKEFEQLSLSSIEEALSDEDALPRDYLERQITILRRYLQETATNGFALLIVQT